MNRTCLKCDHTASMPGLPTDECPACGAIYNKVEEFLNQREAGVVPAPPQPKAARKAAISNRAAYVEKLRSQSLYPTARWWTNLMHTIVTVLCALGLIGALYALAKIGLPALFAVAGLVVFWLFSRIAKELSMMIIDLCDASVQSAFIAEQRAQKGN